MVVKRYIITLRTITDIQARRAMEATLQTQIDAVFAATEELVSHHCIASLLRSLISFDEGFFPVDFGIRLHHASFGDFLCDQERSKYYYVDREECMYTGFCDAFCVGCNMLGSMDGGIESALVRHREGLSVAVTFLPDAGEATDISASR